MAVPKITVFGSQRVKVPVQILADTGRVILKQKHSVTPINSTSEFFQQISAMLGMLDIPTRLRPFLNVPSATNGWLSEHDPVVSFQKMYSDTDIFVVEISSSQSLHFKSFYLDHSRLFSFLVSDSQTEKDWWNLSIQSGKNQTDLYNFSSASPLQGELARGLQFSNQDIEEITRDLRRIKAFVQKAVIFVCHFDTDYRGSSIPQRRLVVDATRRVSIDEGVTVFDPTAEVISFGVDEALSDLNHYKPNFEPVIAESLLRSIEVCRTRYVRSTSSNGQRSATGFELRFSDMVRNSASLCIREESRMRHFVAPFQKRVVVRSSPLVRLFLRLLTGNQHAEVYELGVGLGFVRGCGVRSVVPDNVRIVTGEFGYLLPKLRELAPAAKFCELGLGHTHFEEHPKVILFSGVLERVPDPRALLTYITLHFGDKVTLLFSLQPVDHGGRRDDVYQTWTDAEFIDFVKETNRRVILSAELNGSRCFVVGPFTESLAEDALRSVLSSEWDFRAIGNGSFLARIDGVDQMISENDGIFSLSLKNSPIGESWSQAVVAIEGVDDVGDALVQIRDHAVLSTPPSVREVCNEQVLTRIRECVKSRIPLSVVRIGHADLRVLGYPSVYPSVWLNRSLKVCFGTEVQVNEYGRFLLDLAEAVDAADVMCVPNPDSKDNQHATGAFLMNRERIGLNALRFYGDLHFTLLNSGILDDLIRQSDYLTIVTSRDIVAGLARKFPHLDVRLVQIPGEAKFMGESARRHVPDVYDELVRDLSPREAGELFLIGAGLAAKKYCQVIRDRGGIAVDIGSVFDLWAGAVTRTGFEHKIEDFRL